MDKAILIDSIEKEYEVFNFLLDELSEEEILRPGACGDWSVKDIVVHMAVHERRMLKWMDETLKGQKPIEYQPYDSPDKQLNELNQQIYLENKDRPWEEVFHEWENIHRQTMTWIKSASDDVLFDSSKFHLLDGEPLWAAVAANTFEHCEEHGRDICILIWGKSCKS